MSGRLRSEPKAVRLLLAASRTRINSEIGRWEHGMQLDHGSQSIHHTDKTHWPIPWRPLGYGLLLLLVWWSTCHGSIAATGKSTADPMMSAFGRTAKDDAGRGIDHGNAASWFVVGGAVKGGIYGAWPGLAPQTLVNGRYLDHSIDFRDLVGEVVLSHLGNANLAPILPGLTFQPVGFPFGGLG